jgi:hypothetical protein
MSNSLTPYCTEDQVVENIVSSWRMTVNLGTAVGFMFFMNCHVAGFHQISNPFFEFLWDGSELCAKIYS